MVFIICLIVIAFSILAWRVNREKRASLPAIAVAIIAGLVALSQLFVVVPAGHVGVVDIFGKVRDSSLSSGLNIVNPLAKVVRMSVKTQEVMQSLEVPSKEGLTISLDMSVLFHLDPEKAQEVYKSIGPDYIEIILVPQFRSVIREITSSYEAKALYTEERGNLTKMIKETLASRVAARGIIIEDTPPRKVLLPQGLVSAIEAKLRAEQESQRMKFVLEREKLEAERKRIEARGIADFQDIVSKGISEQLLKWKGIEATEKLAGSNNAKVVIVGGKDGLPLILNTK